MLKSFALREREQPLTVYGPRGLKELMGAMRVVYGAPALRAELVELEPAETVERDGYRSAAIPVSHRGAACYGYVLLEEDAPGAIRPRAGRSSSVSSRGRTSAACSAGRRSGASRPSR